MPMRIQFSIRTLLIAVGLLCVSLAFTVFLYSYLDRRYGKQRRAAFAIERIGGKISYFPSGVHFSLRDVKGVAIRIDEANKGELPNMAYHLQAMSHLEVLTLGGTAIDDDTFKLIGPLQSLNRLQLYDTHVKGEGLSWFRQTGRLQELYVQKSPFEDSALAAIASLPLLRSLTLRDTAINGSGFKYFDVKNRVSLEQKRDACDKVYEEGGHLTHLDLSGSPIDDSAMDLIARLSYVSHLSLSRTNVSDAGIRRIAHSNALEWIVLSGTRITGKGFDNSSLAISYLDLTNANVDDEGLAVIATVRSLERLELNGTQISDNGLKYLRLLPKLKYLSIEDTAVTDGGIDSLLACVSLQYLDTNGTVISRVGSNRLRQGAVSLRWLNRDSIR